MLVSIPYIYFCTEADWGAGGGVGWGGEVVVNSTLLQIPFQVCSKLSTVHVVINV